MKIYLFLLLIVKASFFLPGFKPATSGSMTSRPGHRGAHKQIDLLSLSAWAAIFWNVNQFEPWTQCWFPESPMRFHVQLFEISCRQTHRDKKAITISPVEAGDKNIFGLVPIWWQSLSHYIELWFFNCLGGSIKKTKLTRIIKPIFSFHLRYSWCQETVCELITMVVKHNTFIYMNHVIFHLLEKVRLCLIYSFFQYFNMLRHMFVSHHIIFRWFITGISELGKSPLIHMKAELCDYIELWFFNCLGGSIKKTQIN